jgi:hypothetical protein
VLSAGRRKRLCVEFQGYLGGGVTKLRLCDLHILAVRDQLQSRLQALPKIVYVGKRAKETPEEQPQPQTTALPKEVSGGQ